MPAFGKTSRQRLKGVHPDLVAIAEDVVKIYDITVLQLGGVRTLDDQKDLVKTGVSKTLRSKHLLQDDGYGHAIDIAPYPINWNDIEAFAYMAGLVRMAAEKRGIELRWGGDFNRNLNFHDDGFKDCPHFELVD